MVLAVGSCAPAEVPAAQAGSAGVHINTGTPQGVRAQQVMDMLNSDWPIGHVGVETLAAPDQVDAVVTTMDGLWWDRPYTLSAVEFGAGSATLRLQTSYGARQDIELDLDDAGMVDRFEVISHAPQIDSWADVDDVLSRTGARYSYRVSRIVDGGCEQVAGANTAESLPLASIFKLYVLYAVAEEVRDGALSWDEELVITEATKAVGSSGFDKLSPGAKVPVRDLAEKMIANSDNMATDMLIARVGTEAVERALVHAGHHDPASMTPFPTMRELFSIGWGAPDVREQWKRASREGRAEMLRDAKTRPYQPDPKRSHSPASPYGAEWYGSAEDICRVHAGLQSMATGRTAPVKDIVSAIPGIDLDRAKWPYIAAKAGNLPGDLTFSWYAADHTGQPWVLSLQMNWPRYHSPATAGWLMMTIKQMFGLIPVGRPADR
ncbi:serine hydrolase [[Mycobacterium] wendilense]|uniref:Serine hydrolase n=1 Tax=[Mycobacterium] wendilense TaxID=3064284 RepID=A0ABM9M8Q8_9MYCO|nr:serine hydrolase [Mycolicibacterium sp. MU0050]CAJ1579181.1 serine hydrolase [Mycolicibacterium sp. MU0050]